MSTTNHYISVTDPSVSAFTLASGGASGASNVHDGTSSTTADLVEVRWVSNTVLANTVNRKQFIQALELIKRHVLKGGFSTSLAAGQDANIPV